MRLRPLSTSHAAALTNELLGADLSVAGLVRAIWKRAAGNPFFVEEIVRDLAEQGVLEGPAWCPSSAARSQRRAGPGHVTSRDCCPHRPTRRRRETHPQCRRGDPLRFDIGLLTAWAP